MPILYNIEEWKYLDTVSLNKIKFLAPIVKIHWLFLSCKTPVYIFNLVLIEKANISTSSLL
jgi:hypothetical protein